MIRWLKLDVNILSDEKIRIIRSMPGGSDFFVLWIGILCVAMKSPNPGTLQISEGIRYDEDMLSTICDLPIKTVKIGLETFRRLHQSVTHKSRQKAK